MPICRYCDEFLHIFFSVSLMPRENQGKGVGRFLMLLLAKICQSFALKKLVSCEQ